jgi:hypothetical protein
MRGRKVHPPRRSGETGVGLIEVLIAAVILSTALLALLSVSVHSIRLDNVTRESGLAVDVARTMFEELRSEPVEDVFARYNADPADDPGGPNTAPGNAFVVVADQHGLTGIGEVIFPVNAAGELREDMNLPELGMPRDLNGDDVIDGLDHRDDYIILPVRVRMSWRGASGDRDKLITGVLLP